MLDTDGESLGSSLALEAEVEEVEDNAVEVVAGAVGADSSAETASTIITSSEELSSAALSLLLPLSVSGSLLFEGAGAGAADTAEEAVADVPPLEDDKGNPDDDVEVVVSIRLSVGLLLLDDTSSSDSCVKSTTMALLFADFSTSITYSSSSSAESAVASVD